MTREEKIIEIEKKYGKSEATEQLRRQKDIDVEHLENYYFNTWWRKREELENTKKYNKKWNEIEKHSGRLKNKKDYIEYFKAWKSYIKFLFKLYELPKDEVDRDIFEHMCQNTAKYYAEEANERYNRFSKTYKKHMDYLKENKLQDIPDLIELALLYSEKSFI